MVVQHRGSYALYAETGEVSADFAGCLRGDFVRSGPAKLSYEAALGARVPTVGDWVAISVREGEQRAILPRRTLRATRSVAARLSADPRRQLRHGRRIAGRPRDIAMAQEGGARAVVLITKADLSSGAAASIEPSWPRIGARVLLAPAGTPA